MGGCSGIVLRSFAAVVAAALVPACDDQAGTGPAAEPVELRLVAPARALFDVGATMQVDVRLVDSSGATIEASGTEPTVWSSDDAAVLTVDQTGLVTAVSEGTTRIRATLQDFTGSEQLWVVRDLTGVVAVADATVLPMDGTAPLPDHTVLVEGGIITALGPSTSVVVPPEASVVDAGDLFLIPGLTDAHTHPEEETDFVTYLANGVTTVISLGHHDLAPVLQWRDRIAAGELLGPTVYATGRILDGAGPRARATIVTDPHEARSAVQDQVAAGVDFLKVYNSLSTPVFRAIMDEARSLGVGVVGHGVREPGFQGIIDEGIGAIAHMEEVYYTHFGSNIDRNGIPEALSALQDGGTWVMPNLSTFERVTAQWGRSAALEEWLAGEEGRYVSPERAAAWRAFHSQVYATRSGSVAPIMAFLVELTGAFHDGGVPFLLATDSPIIPGMFAGYSIHDDLRLLVQAGLTPMEALEVGTRNGGRFVADHRGGTEAFGTISVGSRGDLVLLGGDPTLDLTTLRSPHGVMVRGRFLSGFRLEQLVEDMAREWRP